MENRLFEAYAVKILESGEKERHLLAFSEWKDMARSYIRDAIASGFDYGYIKQGHELIASYNEKSFLIRSIH